jgi:hypothetical protein
MAKNATIPLEKITASALKLLTHEQLYVLCYRINNADAVCAHALDLLEPPQLVEIATYIAYEALKKHALVLVLLTDDIDTGIIDFDVEGENQYLTIVCQQLIDTAGQEGMTETKYHAVTAILSAAKIIAAEKDEPQGKELLDEGVKLNDMPPNTKERAIATRDYFQKLFKYIGSKIKIK